MKSLILLSLLSLSTARPAHAGSAQASLECKSASGRTTISGTVPGDSTEIGVKLGVDNKGLVFINADMKEIIELNHGRVEEEYPGAYVAETRYEQSPQSFYLEAKVNDEALGALFLKLEGVPGSYRFKRIPNGSAGQFKATLNGSDPRANPGRRLPEIAMVCRFVYQI